MSKDSQFWPEHRYFGMKESEELMNIDEVDKRVDEPHYEYLLRAHPKISEARLDSCPLHSMIEEGRMTLHTAASKVSDRRQQVLQIHEDIVEIIRRTALRDVTRFYHNNAEGRHGLLAQSE
ncbi:hypothetical protein FNV43_RR04897 [Rhamnella rubrinervis]|uniref:Uncharacterized protein n=1 Tax=Rhamnella rubrinervis TaxID=2594499 RepID=A0A8K0HL82_9ROSA|nr:hypothetical protein FNV43_RR04897 [Rhamnella rubrinervis]